MTVLSSIVQIQCLLCLQITVYFVINCQFIQDNVKKKVDLVLRLALLLSSEGTTDVHQLACTGHQTPRFLNSTLAFRLRLYGETSSLDPFNLQITDFGNENSHVHSSRTSTIPTTMTRHPHTNSTSGCPEAGHR